MSTVASVRIHATQFPEQVQHDLLESLRTRRVNHKFHYDSVKQTQKWLALHQAYSPTRNDADCRAIYEKGFTATAAQIKSRRVDVIGLGCGGGQKDTRLLKRLKAHGQEVFYTPCDVSTAMVLTARESALAVVPQERCFPFVCNLATAKNLEEMAGLARCGDPAMTRLVTFFGMIPNFEPQDILPKLASLVRPRDFLLFSANLAPGADYAAGMNRILPQYDNDLTRDWLMTFLLDIGVEQHEGRLQFAIEAGRFGLKRIVARFHFRRPCRIQIESKAFNFKTGDAIQLFFSYRYTRELVRTILARYRLKICEQWIMKSGEEGVFLCRNPGGSRHPGPKSED